MPALSRECIRDTLMAKRYHRKMLTGLIKGVYDLGIRNLRDGQLAPYIATKLRPNRYLDMQALKRAAPKVVVEVKNNEVVRVWSTNPYTEIDWFDVREDPVYAACVREDIAANKMTKIVDEEELYPKP